MSTPATEAALARTIGLRSVHAYLRANGWNRDESLGGDTADICVWAEDEQEAAIVPATVWACLLKATFGARASAGGFGIPGRSRFFGRRRGRGSVPISRHGRQYCHIHHMVIWSGAGPAVPPFMRKCSERTTDSPAGGACRGHPPTPISSSRTLPLAMTRVVSRCNVLAHRRTSGVRWFRSVASAPSWLAWWSASEL